MGRRIGYCGPRSAQPRCRVPDNYLRGDGDRTSRWKRRGPQFAPQPLALSDGFCFARGRRILSQCLNRGGSRCRTKRLLLLRQCDAASGSSVCTSPGRLFALPPVMAAFGGKAWVSSRAGSAGWAAPRVWRYPDLVFSGSVSGSRIELCASSSANWTWQAKRG